MNKDFLRQLNIKGLVPASQQKSEESVKIVSEQVTIVEKPASKLAKYLPLSLLVIVSSLAHGIGMFRYPYYENDEGVYISQAWSLMTQGTLSPYTYWYDHAPAGWMLLGVWFKAVGGLFTFGSSIDSGRVFMLVLHILGTILVFSITKKLTRGKMAPALLAGLIFSLSPLAVYFQRRVLLDNIMVFWVLLSFWTLLLPKLRLKHITLSALFFGIAVLTKETAIFFLPAFVYTAWIYSHKSHKMFAMSLWLGLSGLMVSLYPLFALLNNELFPQNWFNDKNPHVSLIETLKLQAGRGSNLHFWQQGSDFYRNAVEWFARDPFLIIVGGLALVIAIIFAFRRTEFKIAVLFVLGMLFFLMRGGVVINFYILPLVPFLAIVIAMVLEKLFVYIQKILSDNLVIPDSTRFSEGSLESMYLNAGSHIARPSNLQTNSLVVASGMTGIAAKNSIFYGLGFLVFATLMLASMLKTAMPLYTVNETAPMQQAVTWIKQNLPSNSVLVIDNAIFADLRESRFPGDPTFPYAEWFWKVEKDKTVYNKNINGDWLNVDYVILSHEMLVQTYGHEIKLTRAIVDYSSLVTGWTHGGAFLDVDKNISTNGDWMRVYKVHSKQDYVLESLWKEKATTQIKGYGQIVKDPWNTTANDQGEALLQAVIAGDRDSFNGLWSWTRDHLQYRPNDKLISNNWKIGIRGSFVDQYDAELEANQNIALALILAGRKWNNVSFTEMGTHMVQDLWSTFSFTSGTRTILATTTKQDLSGNYFVDPAVFAPAYYRVFATVDTTHPWETLASESYVDMPSLETGNYTTLNVSKTGNIYANSPQATPISKIVNNIALDAKWFKSPESKFWLEQNANTINQLAQSGSVESRAALLASLEATHSDQALSIYDNTLATYFSRATNTWQQTLTPEEQSSLWLAFAINSMGEDFSKLAQGNKLKQFTALNIRSVN